MPRTRKTLFKQNLNAVPVLIEDNSQESVYFNIKQLSSYFTGGRNAFLITGTGLLELNTSIFIEVLDVDGNPIYVEAIKNFSEAGSRVIVIEVYETTPRGAATLTILGTAKIKSDGSSIPQKWQGVRNVRWQKKLIIEPKSQNVTPIRMKRQPEIIAEELLLTGSLLSQSAITSSLSGVDLQPKFVLNKQRGYVVIKELPFASFHKSPIITGSLRLERRKYTGTIPATTESYVAFESYTSSVNLPLNILNASRSFTDSDIIDQNGNVLNITPLSNGAYEISDAPYTASDNTYIRTASNITGSINYYYVSESATLTTGSVYSFAKLRIVNLDTISGQIFRVKTSVKQAASQTDFAFVADTPTTVGELLITSSADQDDREQPIGYFINNAILTSSWYAHALTGSLIPDPSYGDDTVNASTHISLSRSDTNILDGAYAVTSSGAYFIGTRREIDLFPTSEYTLTFNGYVYTTSGSSAYSRDSYNLDIYLSGSAVVSKTPFGQKIGSISTREKVAYFPNKTFNFTVPRTGSAGLRFIADGGFWEISNVSLKVAEEYAFSPDEVTITVPNDSANSSSLIFKTDLFDLNNNALDLQIVSNPIFFSGSNITGIVGTSSSSYAISASYALSSSYALSASYALSSSYALSASYALSSSYALTASAVQSVSSVPFKYAQFYDTASQSASVNTATPMLLRSTDFSNGVSIVSSSRITVSNSGVYDLQFSSQLFNGGGGGSGQTVSIWFRVSGSDVPYSTTNVAVIPNSPYVVAAWNFASQLSSGSYVEIMWATDNSNIVLAFLPTSSVAPAVPSVIATLSQIG